MEPSPELQDAIAYAADLIAQSDAIVVGAGAGMGVDSGPPDFRGDTDIARNGATARCPHYPDGIEHRQAAPTDAFYQPDQSRFVPRFGLRYPALDTSAAEHHAKPSTRERLVVEPRERQTHDLHALNVYWCTGSNYGKVDLCELSGVQ